MGVFVRYTGRKTDDRLQNFALKACLFNASTDSVPYSAILHYVKLTGYGSSRYDVVAE
jgi:hypothetical protein